MRRCGFVVGNMTVIALSVVVGCSSSSSSSGGGGTTAPNMDAAVTFDGTPPADSGPTSDAGSMNADAGGGDVGVIADAGEAGLPQPPDLNNIMIAAPPVLTWSEPTPCDSVEIERQDMINPYPPTPQFTVPGSTKTYTDTTATMSGNTYFYRARCVVGALRSVYSNEVAWVHP